MEDAGLAFRRAGPRAERTPTRPGSRTRGSGPRLDRLVTRLKRALGWVTWQLAWASAGPALSICSRCRPALRSGAMSGRRG